ncbi:ribosomal protein L1 [Verruconis gallopava]|uniref:Ribosomal protein L1 n=1 Tax=Verruconis gallopava TaxID=253628 RepID=A0A0D2A473_9PEZI|nr:ribosomal protein L1 [Verruconis gallopava]KIW01588.1 ribosomal protein L1 [Verruconis gallopava]
MATTTTRTCLAQWSRGASASSFRPLCVRVSMPFEQRRFKGATGANSANAAKYKRRDGSEPKKRKQRKTYIVHDLKDMPQFALCDAMRYIRAFEVGSARNPKYEVHINLRSLKNGPVVRNRIRLPHSVGEELRIAAICPPGSKHADAARKAGASLIGEEDIIDAIKEGKIEFDRLVCHEDSFPKLTKAGVGRILGPRGLMPSAKTDTVVKDVGAAVRDLVGGSEYRERLGVVRLAIGKLSFTPEMLQKNIRAFMEQLKKDINALSDRIHKDVHEVVLSSTSSPGFSLNGEFASKTGIGPKELAKAVKA